MRPHRPLPSPLPQAQLDPGSPAHRGSAPTHPAPRVPATVPQTNTVAAPLRQATHTLPHGLPGSESAWTPTGSHQHPPRQASWAGIPGSTCRERRLLLRSGPGPPALRELRTASEARAGGLPCRRSMARTPGSHAGGRCSRMPRAPRACAVRARRLCLTAAWAAPAGGGRRPRAPRPEAPCPPAWCAPCSSGHWPLVSSLGQHLGSPLASLQPLPAPQTWPRPCPVPRKRPRTLSACRSLCKRSVHSLRPRGETRSQDSRGTPWGGASALAKARGRGTPRAVLLCAFPLLIYFF